MERFMNCFHIYNYNLIFSIFLKEERDWKLMTSLSSELLNLAGPRKKGLITDIINKMNLQLLHRAP